MKPLQYGGLKDLIQSLPLQIRPRRDRRTLRRHGIASRAKPHGAARPEDVAPCATGGSASGRWGKQRCAQSGPGDGSVGGEWMPAGHCGIFAESSLGK